MEGSASTSWLAAAGIIGVAVFAATVLALHVVQPDLSPLEMAISFYVHGRHGWLLTLGLLALGLGSLALAIALSVQKTRSRLGLILLGAWSAGVIVGGIFATDPPGNWDRRPSVSGTIHGLAAMIAFTALPAAAVFITRSLRQDAHWRPLQSTLELLAIALAASYVTFMVSLTPAIIRPGPPILLGVAERVLIVVSLAWLAVVAIGLRRIEHAAMARP